MSKTISYCKHCNGIADIDNYEETVKFRDKKCNYDEYYYHELPEAEVKELAEAWGYESEGEEI